MTFEEYVFQLFDQKKTKSEEFNVLVRYYGRKKLEALWEKYKAIKFPVKSNHDFGNPNGEDHNGGSSSTP